MDQVSRARGCSERLVAPATEEHGDDEREQNGGVEHEKDIIDETLDEQNEAAPHRKPTVPAMPCQADQEDHRRTHWPYRTWCKFCNMGRGLGEQRGGRCQEHAIPIVGIDYFFITADGFKLRKELKHPETEDGEKELLTDRLDGSIVKCVLVRCTETKCVFAHVVPCKGSDEDNYVVDLVSSDVAWLGHVKLLLKSDNEKSLLVLVKKMLLELKCQVPDLEKISDETSVPYDSQGNGSTEIGVRTVRGQFRTLKFCLEDRIGQRIPAKHALTSWILEHSCFVLNAVMRGADGMTGWARARGRDFNGKIYSIAEQVFWKPPLKGPQHDPQGNMGPRLFPGTFLGFHRSSNAYWVLDEAGNAVKSRALNSKPYEERWNREILENLSVTPWSLRVKSEPEKVPLGERVEKQQVNIKDVVTNPRRLKITMKVLQEFGTTQGCQQCDHIRAFQEIKPGIQHSDACRRRIMNDMATTAEGRLKLENYEGRVNRAIAERHDDTLGGERDVGHPLEGSDPAAAEPRGEAPDPEPAERRESVHVLPRPSASSDDATAADREFEQASREARERYPGPMTPGIRGGMGLPADEVPTEIPEDVEMFTGLMQYEDDCMTLIAAIGVETKHYRKEHRQSFRKVISEIYSPPRVTKLLSMLPTCELAPGFALDLTCIDPHDGKPWDFDIQEKRERALALVRKQKPLFLIGSPMCTAFCTWQRLNAQKSDSKLMERKLENARRHMEFVTQLYREQVEGGRYFLHEHPKFATSWAEKCMKDLMDIPGVALVHADQCQYGAEVLVGLHQGQPIKKPTGFLSNAPRLLDHLRRRCEGRGGDCSRPKRGKHVMCEGRIARDAARYSKGLCKAIIKGMISEMRQCGISRPGEVGLNAVTDDAEDERQMSGPEQGFSGKYRDDITGQVLMDVLVQEARAKELKYFHDKGVWAKCPKDEARRRTGRKAISVRWVDVNKGDNIKPRYRSRLVARQLKAQDRSGASFFAPTPPLEALRTVLSMTASTMPDWRPCYDPRSERRIQISLVDIARAYFNAAKDEDDETYVDLPAEDEDHMKCCARLLRHMYGTRSAADGWQEEYSSFLVEVLGFEQGMSSPCLFKHPVRQLVCSVHGDDFTTTGAKNDLDWFEGMIQEHYECTVQPRLGPGDADAKEGTVLNRIIRWGKDGIEYEADPRQTEKLLAECGLAGANTVATPGVRLSFDEATKDVPLEPRLHTAFRGAAARANYLAADRVDCQFAAKEICRCMAHPNQAAWNALRRLCRYLVGLPRLVFVYRWQDAKSIEVYTDTDWAGCPRTRKSTSGGCIMVGSHVVKSWSSTQSNVALSSGEAEFNGVVRGSGAGLGYQSLMRDLGQDLPLRVWTDSSAAMGTCARQGLGKLRHLDTHTLWIQQAVRSKRLQLVKIAGDVNPADIFTKHSLTRERLMKLSALFSCRFMSGRAESAPQTRTTAGSKTTMAEANVLMEVRSQGETDGHDPHMPHLHLDEEQLQRLHPPLCVPEDRRDESDLCNDDDDEIIIEGERVVREIVEEARAHGRRRHPRSWSERQEASAVWSRDSQLAARPGEASAAWSRGSQLAARPGVVRQGDRKVSSQKIAVQGVVSGARANHSQRVYAKAHFR